MKSKHPTFTVADIRVGDQYHKAGAIEVWREVTLIWTQKSRACRTPEEQQQKVNDGDPPGYVEYKQYKLEGGRPRYGQCGIHAFLRWVNTPPRKPKKKCPHCNGTGVLDE